MNTQELRRSELILQLEALAKEGLAMQSDALIKNEEGEREKAKINLRNGISILNKLSMLDPEQREMWSIMAERAQKLLVGFEQAETAEKAVLNFKSSVEKL